jgi:hypothetical protein
LNWDKAGKANETRAPQQLKALFDQLVSAGKQSWRYIEF